MSARGNGTSVKYSFGGEMGCEKDFGENPAEVPFNDTKSLPYICSILINNYIINYFTFYFTQKNFFFFQIKRYCLSLLRLSVCKMIQLKIKGSRLRLLGLNITLVY